MTTPCFQIDAFSNGPFTGNPAAVCILPYAATADWMQAVASEMNLAETAFVLDFDRDWQIRWFTPTVEVELCGHATLAAAHALLASGRAGRAETLRFSSQSGVLTALAVGGDIHQIELDFPEQPATPRPVPDGLADALGVKVTSASFNGIDWLVELPSETHVVALTPDFDRLASIATIRGVIVTALASRDDADFVSRFFGPAVGIEEDPVTGSAHCTLAPYWAPRLDKKSLVGYQASPRGGFVHVELDARNGFDRRVKLRGQASLIWRGELIPPVAKRNTLESD